MVHYSSFIVLCSSLMVACAFAANEAPRTNNQEQVTEVFRPEAGKFPPLTQAHTYQGELAFVDHVNRRGRLRDHCTSRRRQEGSGGRMLRIPNHSCATMITS